MQGMERDDDIASRVARKREREGDLLRWPTSVSPHEIAMGITEMLKVRHPGLTDGEHTRERANNIATWLTSEFVITRRAP